MLLSAGLTNRCHGRRYCLQCIGYVAGPVIFEALYDASKAKSLGFMKDKLEFYVFLLCFGAMAGITHYMPRLSEEKGGGKPEYSPVEEVSVDGKLGSKASTDLRK